MHNVWRVYFLPVWYILLLYKHSPKYDKISPSFTFEIIILMMLYDGLKTMYQRTHRRQTSCKYITLPLDGAKVHTNSSQITRVRVCE